MAHAYPVHEAKAKLSEILRRVKKGGSVTISERGRAIARVIPIDGVIATLQDVSLVLPGRSLQPEMHEVLRQGRLRGGRSLAPRVRAVRRQ